MHAAVILLFAVTAHLGGAVAVAFATIAVASSLVAPAHAHDARSADAATSATVRSARPPANVICATSLPDADPAMDTAAERPSRVSFVRRPLRELRHQRRDPFGTRASHQRRIRADVSRAVELERLAAVGLQPRFRSWRRAGRATTVEPGRSSGSHQLVNPFEDDTMPLRRPVPRPSIHAADAERWTAATEAATAAAGCPCIAPSPGRVPDGAAVPGVPLTVTRNQNVPGDLDVAWSASCADAADDYSLHAGTIGAFYSHAVSVCTTGGALQTTIAPRPGARYYLVVPLGATAEGSYGRNSFDEERPRSSGGCRAEQVVEACP